VQHFFASHSYAAFFLGRNGQAVGIGFDDRTYIIAVVLAIALVVVIFSLRARSSGADGIRAAARLVGRRLEPPWPNRRRPLAVRHQRRIRETWTPCANVWA
jgi:hypothetical protein